MSECKHLNFKNEPGFTCADCGEKFEMVEERMAKMEKVIEAARYLISKPMHENPSEVCTECGTYGVGELREALAELDGEEKV